MKVKFKEWDCRLVFAQYAEGNVAVMLYGDDGQRVAVASVNVVDVGPTSNELPDNTFYVKDWSENQGMTNALIAAEVIDPLPATGDVAMCGWKVAVAYKLTDKAIKFRKSVQR